MKKTILFSLLFALFLSACTPKAEKSPEETLSTMPEGITIAVVPETLTPEGASFVLQQTTDLNIQYGNEYTLQRLEGYTWEDVTPIIENYGFHSIAYELSQNTPYTLDIDWAWLYGSLPAGEYRLVKEFMDFRDTSDFDKYTITATFSVA